MSLKKTNKKLKIAYFILVLIFTFLLYKQHSGFNIFIISLLSVGYLTFTTQTKKNKQWWLSALLWTGSGLSIFLSHTYLGGLLFFLTGFNFISVNYNSNYSFPFTLSHTFFSFTLGIARFVSPKKKEAVVINNTQNKTENKILKSVFLYGTPLIIVLIFLKLYQIANPKFEEYTQFLNLEFIEWPFILLYVVLSFLLYGFYLYNKYQNSENWDLNTINSVDFNYSDSFQKSIGTGTEQKMATLLLVTLNVLLIAFLIIDATTLFSMDIDSELTHSQSVHQGINVLITSILLVILIVGFIYRGALNFSKNKTIKTLTILWLVLNLVITFFNSLKNFNYINEWGLTHKRIGVFIYLALCVIGLLFTLYKVLNTKTFVFLIKRVSFSFVSFLVAYSLVNWNSIIISYNLNTDHFEESRIDLDYNYSLGYSTYPELVDYFKKHPESDTDLYKKLDYEINYIKRNKVSTWKNFPSLKWNDYKAQQRLENYVPLINNDYNGRNTWYD